jgi:hypothetical protein
MPTVGRIAPRAAGQPQGFSAKAAAAPLGTVADLFLKFVASIRGPSIEE